MYPNPQDVLPLPPRPDVEQYRKRAKQLVKACKSGSDEIERWATQWMETLRTSQPETPHFEPRDRERRARQIAEFARERLGPAACALSQAQFVIARVHGFASWPKLLRHIEALAAVSEMSAFERAADAIVSGDLATLDRLLAARPELIRARSARDHRATLLHYVSANGVENYRQKTPPNIVSIARRLLDAGAELDAEADVYGGGATTFGLVVTSAHPRAAGVQIELADLFLDRGARVDARAVWYCLMNGCPEAAAHLAARGAPFSAVDAAGIGRIDVLARAFEPARTISRDDEARALMMAAWYDQIAVIEYLIDHGVDVGTREPKDGDTALHIAAHRGNPTLTALLLARGAPVDAKDAKHGTSPLVWGLHAWLAERREPADRYRAVARMLVDAGAEVKSEWLDDDRIRADPELYAAMSRAAAR